MPRMYIDCREMPSENNCDLAMSGSEEHLLDAAVAHAVAAHGHEETPELREQVRGALKEAAPGVLRAVTGPLGRHPPAGLRAAQGHG